MRRLIEVGLVFGIALAIWFAERSRPRFVVTGPPRPTETDAERHISWIRVH